MEWFYNYGGESHAITLRPYVPVVENVYDGKYAAVRFDGKIWYTPVVELSHETASDIHVNYGGQTLAISTNPDLILSKQARQRASQSTLIADSFDFSVQNEDGSPIYTNMTTIVAAQADSSIIGNSNANTFFIAGGEENILAGNMGKDTTILDKADIMIVDWGIGVVKTADNLDLPESITDERYNPLDAGSYCQGYDVLKVNGSITGIYFENTPVNPTKKYGVFDAAVTYDDSEGVARVAVLKNILKTTTKVNETNASGRLWKDNQFSVGLFKLMETVGGEDFTYVQGSSLSALMHNWEDFPEDLRPKLIKLYQMYDESDFICSALDLEVNHQTLPDWLTGE